MVQVVPHRGEQVHEAPFDALELPPERRHSLAELPDALALEARVVRHHPARPGARLDERLRERRSGVARHVGDPLVMSEPPTALLYVHAEPCRHLLPWPAPRPARDRQAHGLEVKKGERREAVVVMLGDMVRVTVETLALFGELLAWTGEGCGKAVVQAHKHEAMYVDRPEALLADVDTPEDFAAVKSEM